MKSLLGVSTYIKASFVMESAPGYIAYQYLANHIFDEVVVWCSNTIPSTIFNEVVGGSSNMFQDTFVS